MADYDYRGAIHCHSKYSDGTGTFDEIAAAANDAGLDFVMMTDHETLKPRKDGHVGWKDSTLFIVGAEITPKNNHYIVFGDKDLKGVSKLREKEPQAIIDEVKKQGWMGFIAHPDHQGTEKFEVPSYKWEAWDAEGFTGMGIWDLMTDWQAQLDRDDLTPDLYHKFSEYLTGPRAETIERWDQLLQKGKVVGIGEIDNHNIEREYEGEKYNIFPYELAFKTITNHILLDGPLSKDAKEAEKQILDTIRHGRMYVSFDFDADPTEFSFEVDNNDGQVGKMGDEIPFVEGTEVVVSLPEDGLINILRDGTSLHEEQANEALIEVDQPGVYRVEVIRNELVWIMSNAIWVK